jgi:CPA1 family monovalent cation:H+ antiporter
MSVGDIEFLLLLLIAAVALVRVAELVHVPFPIVLVLGGLAIALIPGLPEIALPPDVIFLIFLPPLVQAAGWLSSPQQLRAIVRPLGVLAVLLVFATAAVVAVLAHALVPGMSWAAAGVLGAVLAPTDVVAPAATFARLQVPERLRLIVEGESMINDGTALVLFRIAVGIATGGALSAGDASLEFLANILGGVAVGLAVGWLATLVIRRQTDTPLVILISILQAYGAYIGAEELHVSGILAAVVAGLYGGYSMPTSMDADTRLTALAFWKVFVFGLEVTLFVLLGLQLPLIVEALDESPAEIVDLARTAIVLAAAMIALRMAVVFLMGREAGDDWRERFIVGWSGMRGAVSLAAALAVPLEVQERPEIVFLTFALILLTLVGQGLTLPLLLRTLRIREARPWTEEEAAARMEAAQAALDRIDDIEEEGGATEEQLNRLRELYRTRFRICAAVLGGEDPGAAAREERTENYGRLRRELIGVERETLGGLRSQGRLRSQTHQQIGRDLDLEEARVRT